MEIEKLKKRLQNVNKLAVDIPMKISEARDLLSEIEKLEERIKELEENIVELSKPRPRPRAQIIDGGQLSFDD